MSELPPDFGPDHPDWNMPSKKNRYFLEKRYKTLEKKTALLTDEYVPPPKPPKVCISTTVSGPYQWYVPLFLDRILKEYPEYDPIIILRGENLLKQYYEIWDFVRDFVVESDDHYHDDGFLTAALRFLDGDKWYGNTDYVLITDVDILIQRENPTLLDQHLLSMEKNGLDCYDNYTVNSIESSPILPGVHFVTQDWWNKTKSIRHKYLKEITSLKEVPEQTDEKVLGKIVVESGLKRPPKTQNLWAIHGIHLGYYRRKLNRKNTIQMDATHQQYVKRLRKDSEFIDLVNSCGQDLPEILEIFDILREKRG